jgi:hypothetical protein
MNSSKNTPNTKRCTRKTEENKKERKKKRRKKERKNKNKTNLKPKNWLNKPLTSKKSLKEKKPTR